MDLSWDDRVFLTWDEIGFPDYRAIVEETCDSVTAAHLLARITAAERAYDDPGRVAAPLGALDDDVAVSAIRHIQEDLGRRRAELAKRLSTLDGAYLLGAVAALGGVAAVGEKDPISVPGRFDRELEWLAELPLLAKGGIPRWEDVLIAIAVARRSLVAMGFANDPRRDDAARVRQRSVTAADLGSTYVPVARELTERLVKTAVNHVEGLSETRLADFGSDTDRVFDEHVGRAEMLVSRLSFRAHAFRSHAEMLKRLMGVWSVKDIVDALRLTTATSRLPGVIDLTCRLEHGAPRADLRSRPLVDVGGSAVLLLPRRIGCDRHELLDLAVSRLGSSQALGGTRYPDLRAVMLDHVVADVLQKLLPGSDSYIGRAWTLHDVVYERDVVVLFDDIAVCVETKAPQMVPTRKAGFRDAVHVLREEMAEGVSQVTSIADALEAGTAVLDGTRIPRVRRAYRLVVSFNTWWGIDLDVELLHRLGVLPHVDAAMLTCAPEFICYEKIFRSPADFIAYLDFRLMHQRRPWVTVSDEMELIGGLFTNPSDRWLRKPAARTRYLVKPTFQSDIDAAVRAVETGEGQRPFYLRWKHIPLVAANIDRWKEERPRGWIQAVSALSRVPVNLQLELDEYCRRRRRSPSTGTPRVERLPTGAGRVIFVHDWATCDRRSLARAIDSDAGSKLLVVVAESTNEVLAVRGIDDGELWTCPEWETDIGGRLMSAGAIPRAGRGQRDQPRRAKKRRR